MLDRAQFQRELRLGHSAYVAAGKDYHLYVGLSGLQMPPNERARTQSTADDVQSAKYYWFLNFYDTSAAHGPIWTTAATQAQMYDFARQKCQSLHPRFREIIELSGVDGILPRPVVYRNLLLQDMPASKGHVTLIGDAAHPMAPCTLLQTASILNHWR